MAARWAQTDDASVQHREVAIAPMDDWQVFYYRGGAWTNSLSSGDAANAQPDGVRLQLNLAPGHALNGTISRDWARSTLAANKS